MNRRDLVRRQALALDPLAPLINMHVGWACFTAGEATAILDRLLDPRRRHYVPAICLARIHSRIGNTAAAIEWLEAAFAERNGEMVSLDQEIAGAAADDPLRHLAGEPGVRSLLDRMRLPNPW